MIRESGRDRETRDHGSHGPGDRSSARQRACAEEAACRHSAVAQGDARRALSSRISQSSKRPGEIEWVGKVPIRRLDHRAQATLLATIWLVGYDFTTPAPRSRVDAK